MQDKIEFLFNEKKARAAAAFTLSLSGGALPLEKLQALLYIADRASLGKYATPITTETWFRGEACPVYGINLVKMFDDGWFRSFGSENVPVTVVLNGHHDYFYNLSYADAETILHTVWLGQCDKFPLQDDNGQNVMGDALAAVLSYPEVKDKAQCEKIPFDKIARAVRPKEHFTEEEWLDEVLMSAYSYNSWVLHPLD